MFVPKCLNNLRKRLVPSEAKPQEEAIQTNGVRLKVPKNEHDDYWTPRYGHNLSQPHTYLMFFLAFRSKYR